MQMNGVIIKKKSKRISLRRSSLDNEQLNLGYRSPHRVFQRRASGAILLSSSFNKFHERRNDAPNLITCPVAHLNLA